MSRCASILLPLDGSPEAARATPCALWLADTLGAALHVVHATPNPASLPDALTRLRVPQQAQATHVVLHQAPGDAAAAVLAALVDHHIDLLVMSARGAAASGPAAAPHRLGSVAHELIERSPVPVVLLPAPYRQPLPWTSMLVGASGEVAADCALTSAVQLGAALRLTVTVVHVEDGPGEPASLCAGYADALYHEYPRRLDRLVERGMISCTEQEAGCLGAVLLCRGDPASVLLDQAARRGSSVIALGWHGTLGGGRARVLERLLGESDCALLLVRGSEASAARLKVGSEIDEE